MLKVFQILLNKVRKNKTDFFLQYKYSRIRNFYGKKCLDIGSGTGRFANYLRNQGHRVRAIDVVNKSEYPNLRMTVFDGKSIPYGNKQFDTTVLMFVLHHTDHARALLKECIRVTKQKIVIGEDIMINNADRILGNIHLGTSPWSKSTNGFKTDPGWLKLFSSYNLKVVETVLIPRCTYPVYPVIRKIYVLEVAQ